MHTGRGVSAAVGLLIDRVTGEPPAALHPVAWFGRGMQRLETAMWADTRRRGVAYATIGAGAGLLAGRVLRAGLGDRGAVACSATLAVAGRMLGTEASAIGRMLECGDLDGARRRLPSLVGRRPDDLSEPEIARAVIESVAENSVDAMIAPALWGLVGGAPAILAYRAVNTLDAMVGHRSVRHLHFGWASARADDLANWVPARLAAALVMVVSPHRATRVIATVRRDAGQHPSPNGGVIEAAFAAALGVTLGGVNRYGDQIEDRGTLGDGPSPSGADIARAVRLLERVRLAMAVTCAAVGSARLVRTRGAGQ